MTREDKVSQLEKILHGRTMQGAENLRAFLRFVAMKEIEGHESQLKEYVIATEVFGRGSDYDPRVDSVVRVQAGRLRSKLLEYYSTEGRDDKVIIDLPKGHYTPVFSYARPATPPNGSEESGVVAAATAMNGGQHHALESETRPLKAEMAVSSKAEEGTAVSGAALPFLRLPFVLRLGVGLFVLMLGTAAYHYRGQSFRLQQALADSAAGVGRLGDSTERQNVLTLWGDLLRAQESVLIVYSNTLFRGTAETGMKLLKPLDAPGSSIGTPVLPQSLVTAEEGNQPISDHYTGIGEVMAGFFLGEFFAKTGYSARVKRSLLLNWEDLKTENIVVLGSSAENLFLRDLPQKQEFIFRPLKDEKQQDTFGIINTKPLGNEAVTFVARQEGRSRSQISEDYAVISLLQGLNEKNRLFILAGITTLGTQAAAEYVTRPEYIKDLIAHLNLAPAGAPPRLPPYYQVLVKVKVNGGVPVQISYVTHHALNQ